jgi:hypothetical protein
MFIGSAIKRWAVYWWESATEAKGVWEVITWFFTIFSWVVVIATEWAGFPSAKNWPILTEPNFEMAAKIVAGLLTLRAVFWLPFRKHEKLISELQKLKSDQVELKLEFINPKDIKDIDFNIYRFPLRVKITHSHPTKTLKNVRVLISKITCSEWKSAINSLPLKKITFPVYLPEAGMVDSSQQHEISPMPFGKTFDVFAVMMNLAESEVWVAPFECPDQQHRNHWAKSEFSITANDFSEGKAKFTIELQVTADGVATLSKIVILEVATYTLNLQNNKGVMNEPPPPRWIV